MSGTMLKLNWIIYLEDIKIAHLNAIKIFFNVSMKRTCEDLPPPKSSQILAKKVTCSTEKELLLEIESFARVLKNIKLPLPQLHFIIPHVFSR